MPRTVFFVALFRGPSAGFEEIHVDCESRREHLCVPRYCQQHLEGTLPDSASCQALEALMCALPVVVLRRPVLPASAAAQWPSDAVDVVCCGHFY